MFDYIKNQDLLIEESQKPLIKKTFDKLGQMIISLLLVTALIVLCIPTSTLLVFYTSLPLQLAMLIILVATGWIRSDTSFIGAFGALYLAPITSYIYFYVANGPLLIFLSLGITCLIFALNFIVMHEIYSDSSKTSKFKELLAKYGQNVLLSLLIVIMAIFILHFLMPLTPIAHLIYSSAVIWYSNLLLILRAGLLLSKAQQPNITENETEKLSFNYATGIFFELLNILIQILSLIALSSENKSGNSPLNISAEFVLFIIVSPFIIIYSIWAFVTYEKEGSTLHLSQSPPPLYRRT
jgi:uncharacterized membrane protein (DUF485 family)